MAVNPADRLDCGTDLDDLWAGIHQPPTEHQRQCPYCTDARAALQPLSELTERYRREEVDSPDLQPDPGMADRIVQIAHTEVRRGRSLPLSTPGPDGIEDGLSVSEQAVASVARRAADAVTGIQVRRCRASVPRAADPGTALPGAALPGADAAEVVARGGAAAVEVQLRLSIASTSSVPQLSPPLRSAVSRAVQQEVGMVVTRIDIAVEDVHDA